MSGKQHQHLLPCVQVRLRCHARVEPACSPAACSLPGEPPTSPQGSAAAPPPSRAAVTRPLTKHCSPVWSSRQPRDTRSRVTWLACELYLNTGVKRFYRGCHVCAATVQAAAGSDSYKVPGTWLRAAAVWRAAGRCRCPAWPEERRLCPSATWSVFGSQMPLDGPESRARTPTAGARPGSPCWGSVLTRSGRTLTAVSATPACLGGWLSAPSKDACDERLRTE